MSDLIDALDVYPVPTDPEERERFVIDDDNKAEWALAKLSKIRADIQAKEDLAESQINLVTAWLAGETSSLLSDAAFFEGLLIAYARNERAKDRKTVSVPSGSVSSRQGSIELVIEDPAALLAWATANLPDVVKVTDPTLDMAALKKLVDSKSDDLPVVTPAGELVPGVTASRKDMSFTVKPVGQAAS